MLGLHKEKEGDEEEEARRKRRKSRREKDKACCCLWTGRHALNLCSLENTLKRYTIFGISKLGRLPSIAADSEEDESRGCFAGAVDATGLPCHKCYQQRPCLAEAALTIHVNTIVHGH